MTDGPRLEPIRWPDRVYEKRTRAEEIDGIWFGPNSCRICGKWFVPYKGGVPIEFVDEYCWGHKTAVAPEPKAAEDVPIGPERSLS